MQSFAVLCSPLQSFAVLCMYTCIKKFMVNTVIQLLFLTSPLSISLVQPFLYQYAWLNLSFINIFGSPLIYEYPWLNLSFIYILCSTSPLLIFSVQSLLYHYPWFNPSFINILGLTSPLSISLV